MTRIRTWGRSASSVPARVERPASVGEVQGIVTRARHDGTSVKAIGSGHSFSPIAMTDGVLVDVSRLAGIRAHDARTGRVTLGAGTRLSALPAILGPLGLALENMGDIDAQTIAGAVSTGTHGTGIRFGGLATQVVGVTFVDGGGSVVRIAHDERAELLPAAQLSLGALGIAVEVELQCVPAFLLHAVERAEPFEVVEDLYDRALEIDHVEAYWWPHTELLSTKSNARLAAGTPHEKPGAVRAWIDDELLGTAGHAALCGIGHALPAATPALNRFAASVWGNRQFTDDSQAVFTTPRRLRFREMEYAIPARALPDALREVRSAIERHGWRVSFPIELRFAAADDVWMSTAYGRETAYVAVHRYWRDDPRAYFATVEEIMRGHGGRPHWGKMHARTRADLEPVIPRMGDFLAARDRLDPDRVFDNAYTRRVLGRRT